MYVLDLERHGYGLVLFWLTVYLAKHSKEKVLVYTYIYLWIYCEK